MPPSRKPRERKTAPSVPKTPSTSFLYQFRGDLLHIIYRHQHNHTLMEFKSAIDKVFEEIHKAHNVKIEVRYVSRAQSASNTNCRSPRSYQQWCSRKDQWDKDWDIKSGGPSKEIREELELLPSWLECHDGVLRPKLLQSGGSLLCVSSMHFHAILADECRPNLDLAVETDIPESCARNYPSNTHLNETWPIEPEASEPW